MTFEQAITIAIPDVLDKLGHTPSKKTSKEYLYLSPLRSEKTPSFTVNIRRNLWFDFGIHEGGGIIKFARAWLKSQNKSSSYPDALRWLADLSGLEHTITPYLHTPVEEEKRIVRKAVFRLRSLDLIDYLGERGIPVELARLYLRELILHDNEKGYDFNTIGFKNDTGGYENRYKNFKGCIGHKAVSSLRGINPEAEGVHLFEGFMDFLSVLVFKEKMKLDDNVIVLNSVGMLKNALPLLLKPTYKYIYTWFDNDEAGNKATEEIKAFCDTHPPLEHTPMNSYYSEHKDVNEWLMHLLS